MNSDAASLDKLHDIVAPAPVPWWPPAPGWFWVGALVAAALLAVLLRSIARWQHNRYRREALAALDRQEAALSNPQQRAAAIGELSELLKRTALTAYPRKKVAALTGAAWCRFLDRTGRDTDFGGRSAAALQYAAYDPHAAARLDSHQLRDLVANVRRWIQTHSTEMTTDD
jgi:hypothetical protein